MLRINKDAFCTIVHEYPEIALQVARVLSERLEGAMEGLLKQFESPASEMTADIANPERLLPGSSKSDEDQQMGMPERVFLLRQINLFKNLPRLELERVAAVAEELRMVPGSELFCDDDTCPGLYLIVDGVVSIEQQQPGDSSSLNELIRLGPGQPFAVTTLFGGKWAKVKARIIEESALLRISSEEFCAISREHPEIALRVCQVLSERLSWIIEKWGHNGQHYEEASSDKKE